MVTIIDYDLGNLKSVSNALNKIGLENIITRNKDIIDKAQGIILPGVGSFSVAMNKLKEYDLINILNKKKNDGTHILGICLGMQILFEKGFEGGEIEGLGFLKGTVEKMNVNAKLPHMGWNNLIFNKKSEILKNIQANSDVYFVHSYMANTIDDELIAFTTYNNVKIPAIVGKSNVIGCQFHPEKSNKIGQKILYAWKEMVEC